jgi:hypothetical protein
MEYRKSTFDRQEELDVVASYYSVTLQRKNKKLVKNGRRYPMALTHVQLLF